MNTIQNKPVDTFYEALLSRDKKYVGVFYAGVRTTSVFCISTCRARKPKRENVVFFDTIKDALDHGYRPCKVCKPTENAHEAPDEIHRAIVMVRGNPKKRISDSQLREHHIRPERVRRWFKRHYGMTFQTFQRMYRINGAFQELKKGHAATRAAFDSGFESLSGFGYTYKKLVGRSPENSKNAQLILINRITTPIGPMFICATEKGVCLLEFVDRRMLETEFSDLQRRLNARIIAGENEHMIQATKEINEYFEGTRQTFEICLDTPGTRFQQAVWAELMKIPYGATTSYQQQSLQLNNPTAVRAVANANGHNRIAIIVPCHRVIGKDGSLTGYGGGIPRKRWLIAHEQRNTSGTP